MALVQWKQISPDLSGYGQLTGSLEISGSLILNGSELNISGGAVSANQTLSINGYELSISDGNTITLPSSSAVDTSDLIVSASGVGNILTFHYGDGSTIDVTIDTGSGTGGSTDISALNEFTSSYYIDSASFDTRLNNVSIDTSSLVTSADYSIDSASFDSRISALASTGAPEGTISSSQQIEELGYAYTSSVLALQGQIDNLTAQTSSYLTSVPSSSLGDLINVSIEGVTDGQLLGYDSASNTWIPVEGQGNGDITAVFAADGLVGGGTTGPVALEVDPGLGIIVNPDGVNIDTASAHFITGVIDLSIFQQTGSVYSTTNDLEITGSLTLKEDTSGDALSVYSGSTKTFSVSGDGLLRMVTQSTTPSASLGVLYLDENYNLFIGQE